MEILLTVVVPTGGESHFIDSWLENVGRLGALAGLDVVVVTGDAHVQEELLSRGSSFPSVMLIACPPGTGPGRARNLGLEAVRTPFVAFVDADDDLDLAELMKAAATLQETGKDLAIAPYRQATEGPTDATINRIVGSPRGSLTRNVWGVAGVWRFIFKTQFLRSHEMAFPDLDTAEDVGFLLEVVKARPSITALSDGWYTYRIHSSTQSSQRPPRSWADVVNPIEGLWRIAWSRRSPETMALAADWTLRIVGVSAKRALRARRHGS